MIRASRILPATPRLIHNIDRRSLLRAISRVKVWSEPMRNLARQYGVSDAYLGRVCRLLRVPLPGLGYWAKKSAGKARKKRPPLPPFPIEKEQQNKD